MADRLRVILEFKKTDMKEIELYAKLLEFSNPAAVVKDILKGVLPVEIITEMEV
ncbi:hypothetical protein 10S11_55 [uncultured Caudovirales phage]|uniref:Uncharacterized protein n=1 Tax=uncultured Caudovirales phage TaxID=2100421 RepID=A0A2H4J4S7_9CAUD|nr:hypothetical protein 10S11_55 [uncultured Caudovirales phage]